MRVSRREMEKSHRRIVASAARLLRERGVAGTGVADVMRAAGLTQGGFYRHFPTRDGLLVAALAEAFAEQSTRLEEGFRQRGAEATVAQFEARYLAPGHIGNPGLGCPVAALSGEIGRASAAVKAAFDTGLNHLVTLLAQGQRGTPQARRAEAARRLARLAGTVAIARASHPATARAILAAGRRDLAPPT